jgi:hypothetical protein
MTEPFTERKYKSAIVLEKMQIMLGEYEKMAHLECSRHLENGILSMDRRTITGQRIVKVFSVVDSAQSDIIDLSVVFEHALAGNGVQALTRFIKKFHSAISMYQAKKENLLFFKHRHT